MRERFLEFRRKAYLVYTEKKFLLAAFVLPLLIQWMIFIAMEVYPFGTSSVLVLDLNGQYVYFYAELRKKLLEGGSLLYTWSRSLGGEFMGIYAYYIASPFAFLTVLFSEDHMTEALLVIELLKTGSMGLTMAYYLHKTKKSNAINIIIFSTCYALSAYAVVYGHNTMWIDCVILLPLLTYGIEQLIKKRKFKLFVVTLALSLLTNFYIGYMVCIYVAIYFFYYYVAHMANEENNFFLEDNHFFKSFARIAWYSFIAICIAMIIVYPAYTSLQFGKNTFSTTNWAISQRFELLDFFVKLLPGSYDTVRPEGLPVVYCGAIVLILLPLYFVNSKVKWQERIMTGLLLVFFFVCFDVSSIDIVWHGFQKPNWLNYRYSFMFIFIVLVMAYKAFSDLRTINYKFAVYTGLTLIVMIMFVQKQDYEYVNTFSTIWLSVLCVVAYAVVMYFVHAGKPKNCASIIVAVFVVVEMFGAGLLNLIALDDDVVISSRTSYNSYLEKVSPSVEWVKEYDTSEFYRMEKNFHRKTNDSMALNFYGISNSTSTLNQSVIELLHTYGYASKSHWTKYLGGTPVADALLDIRYVISNKEIDNGVWEAIHTDDDYNYTVYYNPYALSLAYAVSEDAAELEITDYQSPLVAMNKIVASMLGKDDVDIFTPIEIDYTDTYNVSTSFTSKHRKYTTSDDDLSAYIEYTVSVEAGKPIYLNIPTDYPREATLKLNGSVIGKIMGNESDTVIYLGTFDEDRDISVMIELGDDPVYIMTGNDFFYSMDVDLFKECFETLADGNMEITSFSDTHIEGKVNVPDDCGLLFTSITYDDGWKVYVDGEQKELIKTQDALLAVSVTPGEHEIVFEYLPKCYTLGGAISIFGLVAFAACVVYEKISDKRRKEKWKRDNFLCLDGELK